jgi:hypothetical protein
VAIGVSISLSQSGTLTCGARYRPGVIELIAEWPETVTPMAAGFMVTLKPSKS